MRLLRKAANFSDSFATRRRIARNGLDRGGRRGIVSSAAGLELRGLLCVLPIIGQRWPGLRSPISDTGCEAGFTLVEVIVALAMLSIGLGIALGLISSSLRQTANAERMAEASSLAQSLMDEVGIDLPVNAGERDGQFPNGFRWHLKILPYGDNGEREEWPVGVYTVSTEVAWGEGTGRRVFELKTLRFGPRQARQ